jgi:RNA 2',3'-cyclic 3'-phosphodiesterase
VRLFVAIEIAEDVTRAALALVRELRDRARRLAPRARISWTASERVHVTLSFIGEADAARAAAIVEALGRRCEHEPVTLGVSGVGAFPERGAPRVLWAGIDAGRDRVVEVQRLVEQRLLIAGIPPENRPFHPHVTLARVRDAAGLRTPVLLEGLETASVGAFEARAVTLFESRLSPKGPAYVPMHHMELAGRRDSAGHAAGHAHG